MIKFKKKKKKKKKIKNICYKNQYNVYLPYWNTITLTNKVLIDVKSIKLITFIMQCVKQEIWCLKEVFNKNENEHEKGEKYNLEEVMQRKQ